MQISPAPPNKRSNRGMKQKLSETVLGMVRKLRFRRFCYIYNSRVDFVDFWLCLYIVTTGMVCLYSHPLENIPVYTNLTERGISSNELGVFTKYRVIESDSFVHPIQTFNHSCLFWKMLVAKRFFVVTIRHPRQSGPTAHNRLSISRDTVVTR